jgi:hypothetical protein
MPIPTCITCPSFIPCTNIRLVQLTWCTAWRGGTYRPASFNRSRVSPALALRFPVARGAHVGRGTCLHEQGGLRRLDHAHTPATRTDPARCQVPRSSPLLPSPPLLSYPTLQGAPPSYPLSDLGRYSARGVVLGEGKPENQNHAVIFAHCEALQAIDMVRRICDEYPHVSPYVILRYLVCSL